MGRQVLDASCLRIALVGFLPASDPRIRGTVEAIEKGLMKGGLVQRYNTRLVDDGLTGGEGQFLACSFWMVANLWLIGRKDDAKRFFERLLALRNDVGLLSEEYDSEAQRMVGNFPQALSHIALVHAAFTISGDWTPQVCGGGLRRRCATEAQTQVWRGGREGCNQRACKGLVRGCVADVSAKVETGVESSGRQTFCEVAFLIPERFLIGDGDHAANPSFDLSAATA